MMHKAWRSIEEVPYSFLRSSIKLWKLTRMKNWLFLSNLSKNTRRVAAIKSLRFALFYYDRHVLRAYLDCFTIPTLSQSPSSAHTYLPRTLRTADCFAVSNSARILIWAAEIISSLLFTSMASLNKINQLNLVLIYHICFLHKFR